MRIVKVRDLVKDYSDDGENGVTGFGGLLDIRPAYQREFVYKDEQRKAVIDTVRRGFPLNVMYWVKHPAGTFEVLDGQQRTISICQYVAGDFSIEWGGDTVYFNNLTADRKDAILDYELHVYECEGADSEKLDWFRTINTAGEKLTEQELRNAVYSGTWVSDAKRHFSKTSGPAHQVAGDYLKGVAIRQDYLETAIRWHSKGDIETYMASKQNQPRATELWSYFTGVIDWVKSTFPTYRKEMAGINWGALHDSYGSDMSLDPDKLDARVTELFDDPAVKNRKGVFEYVLGGEQDKKLLNVRLFDDTTKRKA